MPIIRSKAVKRRNASIRAKALKRRNVKKRTRSVFNNSRTPSKSFQKNMKIYENNHVEKKFIPFTNWTNGPASAGYGGILPAVTIPNAGPTGNDEGLSCLILQTGAMLTNANLSMNTTLGANLCYPLGGYALTRGTGSVSDIIGNYIQIKSTLQRVNINVDPASGGLTSADYQARALPRQYRLIMVKAKRDNSVAPGASTDQGSASGSIRKNLWINESNEERGLLDPMSVQDAFTWIINKQKFQVLKDERFTLVPNVVTSFGSSSNLALNNAVGPNGTTAKSQRFKNYYLPTPKNKTKYDTEHAISLPVNFNFCVHTIILCKSMGGSGNPDSKGWSVASNGLTAYTDF